MKTRNLFNYLLAIILSFCISAESLAAYWPKTEAEFALLPPYCRVKMGRLQGLEVPESEINKWKKNFGPGYYHVHHVCAGLHTMYILDSKPNVKDYEYIGAIKTYKYSQRHSPKDFVLQPKISLELGKIYLRLNRVPEAISELQNAIQLKPSYTAPYAVLSDYYIKIGLKDKAKAILEEGLKHSPNSKKLKRRLDKL